VPTTLTQILQAPQQYREMLGREKVEITEDPHQASLAMDITGKVFTRRSLGEECQNAKHDSSSVVVGTVVGVNKAHNLNQDKVIYEAVAYSYSSYVVKCSTRLQVVTRQAFNMWLNTLKFLNWFLVFFCFALQFSSEFGGSIAISGSSGGRLLPCSRSYYPSNR
jgi:hypothetical protein